MAYTLLKGLLSLLLIGLLALILRMAWTEGKTGDLGWAALLAALLVLLWVDFRRSLEPALPWLGLLAGVGLLAGAVALAQQQGAAHVCSGRRTWLCQLQNLLLETGGPWLTALPYALLGALALFAGARALLRRD